MYPLHRWQAFAELADDEQEALALLARREVSYARGTTIRSQGDIASGIYFHVRGWVTSSVMLPSGNCLIQKVHLPGDVLGASSMVLERGADTLTAVTDVIVAHVPFEQLGEVFGRLPRIAALFTFAAQVERLALMDALVATGRASAKEKLARLILDFYARLIPIGAVKNDTYDLPLTQEVIGDIVGLTSVHVNRKLVQLREDGLIEFKCRKLRILDLEGLRSLSPIEPRVVQFEPAWFPKT